MTPATRSSSTVRGHEIETLANDLIRLQSLELTAPMIDSHGPQFARDAVPKIARDANYERRLQPFVGYRERAMGNGRAISAC